jgi:hypothetical protein
MVIMWGQEAYLFSKQQGSQMLRERPEI